MFVINDLYEALTLLGYSSIRKDHSEWRRHEFHLFIRKKDKERLALSIHEDMPSAIPPFHRARHKSKSIEQEFDRIVDAYQKRRQRSYISQ